MALGSGASPMVVADMGKHFKIHGGVRVYMADIIYVNM